MSSAATMTVEHPSVFIREELEARGWSQVDLAYVLGISTQQLSPLLNGKRDISPDMAVALGDAFDVPADFFANLQKLYDLNKAKRPDPGVRTRANWVNTFPVREMIRRGWIEDTEPDLLDLQMMRFFNTNSVQDIPFVGRGDICAHAAKKSTYEEITPIQLVWLHRVRIIARTMDCPAYSKESLVRTLPELRAHMNDKDDLPAIPHILWKCGVRFIVVEPLDGSKIDGVCTWLDGQPVIGVSTRLNRMDNLCFVIRHEIEHVIQEDGKRAAYSHVDVFEPDRNFDELPKEEQRADSAAAEFLVPQDKLNSFMARKGKFISERDVLAFAARHHIHPAVVIGQVQRRRHQEGDDKAYGWLRKYLTGIRGYLLDWEYRDGWGHVASVGL
jgi:HTH-type transcriptional regulator/antitoxin HigA